MAAGQESRSAVNPMPDAYRPLPKHLEDALRLTLQMPLSYGEPAPDFLHVWDQVRSTLAVRGLGDGSQLDAGEAFLLIGEILEKINADNAVRKVRAAIPQMPNDLRVLVGQVVDVLLQSSREALDKDVIVASVLTSLGPLGSVPDLDDVATRCWKEIIAQRLAQRKQARAQRRGCAGSLLGILVFGWMI